jgi:hypothetical protein
MDKIKSPFTSFEVDALNHYQLTTNFHPFTCPNDGDEAHITYEFDQNHLGEKYDEYIINEKAKGINFPEMKFTETSLVATESGWICTVCDYKQNWAHGFMAKK